MEVVSVNEVHLAQPNERVSCFLLFHLVVFSFSPFFFFLCLTLRQCTRTTYVRCWVDWIFLPVYRASSCFSDVVYCSSEDRRLNPVKNRLIIRDENVWTRRDGMFIFRFLSYVHKNMKLRKYSRSTKKFLERTVIANRPKCPDTYETVVT